MNLFSELRANSFEKYTWLCNSVLAQWIVDLLEVYGNSILDVGCGNGFMFDYYRGKFQKIAAIDPSEHIVNSISKTGQNEEIIFKQAPAEKIPFEDNAFDIAFAKSSLHHFENPKEGLSEMYRVSRRVVAIMEVVAPSVDCLPFLSNLLVNKEVGRARTSIFTEDTLKKIIINSIPVSSINHLVYDQYIDVETWIQYSDLSTPKKAELLKYIMSMNPHTADLMQLHVRDGHYVMLRKMCLCIAFLPKQETI